jgi:glycosyltransferase involved in cell wall biosynthesis
VKILFYTPFNLRSRDTESLMQVFLEQKHEVFLLTQAKRGIYHEKCESYGVRAFSHEVTSHRLWFVVQQFFFLVRFARRHKIDVIYAHLENASMIAVLAQYFIRAKVISCRHVIEEPHFYNSRKYLFQVKLVNFLSRKIIVVSRRCKEFMIEVEKVRPSKIVVINLAYNFNLYQAINETKVKEIKSRHPGTLNFIMASRFIDNKRPFEAIYLVEKLRQQGVITNLIILGNGPLEKEIRQYIREHRLENEITLYGYVDNVLDYFSAANILLVPSITESSSVVLKEAGLAGITAIICRDVGDAEDYLEDKREVFLTSKDSFLNEALEIANLCVKDSACLKTMGTSLRMKVKERFSLETNIANYDQFNTYSPVKALPVPHIAFVSSHIHKSLQFEWFQEELKRNGIDNIHIIINTMKGIEPLLAVELKRMGIPCYVFNYKNNFSFFRILFGLRRILKQQEINIVHTTLPYGNLLGQMAALSLGIRARITTCENASWAYDYNSKKQWIIDKFTFWSAKKIISVADTANDFLLGTWKINPGKLIQINHSLKFNDYETVTPQRIKDLENKLLIQPHEFIVGMIARTEFWKGHQYVIEAMARIVPRHPDIKLLICGSVGFDHQKLLNLIAKYKLESHVKFIGFVPDPIAFLKLIKIQVHVPINKYVENCGISIIEGMAAKTPQLLTLSGYSFQSARHLQNAYVVDYCNAKEIEEGIEYLYSDYTKALTFGRQAYNDALEQYTIELKYQKHLEVYRSVLN